MMRTENYFNLRLKFGGHVLLGIFETTAADHDRRTPAEPFPAIIFRPEIAVDRYAGGDR